MAWQKSYTGSKKPYTGLKSCRLTPTISKSLLLYTRHTAMPWKVRRIIHYNTCSMVIHGDPTQTWHQLTQHLMSQLVLNSRFINAHTWSFLRPGLLSIPLITPPPPPPPHTHTQSNKESLSAREGSTQQHDRHCGY